MLLHKKFTSFQGECIYLCSFEFAVYNCHAWTSLLPYWGDCYKIADRIICGDDENLSFYITTSFWLELSTHLTHLLICKRSLLIMEAACCFSIFFLKDYFSYKIKFHIIKGCINKQKNFMCHAVWLDVIVEFVALPGILLC